jgi:hypothetical protein
VFEAPSPSIFSNLLAAQTLNYDTTNAVSTEIFFNSGTRKYCFDVVRTGENDIFKGKRDNTPKFLTTSY